MGLAIPRILPGKAHEVLIDRTHRPELAKSGLRNVESVLAIKNYCESVSIVVKRQSKALG